MFLQLHEQKRKPALSAEDYVIQPKSPESWQKMIRGSTGITHLGMRVRDLDDAINRLKAAGATMISEPFTVAKETTKIVYVANKVSPRIAYAKEPGKKAWRIAFFKDPDGVIIEPVER
jgi:catechol 2,3-dioxygenase-like lactoylglutathione lyase family enzyme